MRQRQALRLMHEGRSVFLTGAPGAGKTHVLNEFIRLARHRGANVAVTASTGIAATHVGGMTIHSWSGLGIREHVSEYDLVKLGANTNLLKRYNVAEVLVIDEISMLHGARLNAVNTVAKHLRQSEEPFGGLQVILVGDLFQLPPISSGSVAPDFAHLSDAWSELDPTICYLTEQHRVQAGDGLLDILSAMRRGEASEFHEEALRERLGMRPPAGETVTRLYSHNVDVDMINQRYLEAITNPPKSFEALVTGTPSKREQLQKSVLAPVCLTLKKNAEVMFVANNFQKGFVNGTRGTVIDFDGNDPIVATKDGREIRVQPHSWSLEEDGRVRAEVTQLPLRLAWAITIHKSQGMSLDSAEIDLSRSFAPGMGYVALSRVRSMSGVYLSGMNNIAMQLHPLIFEFDKSLQDASAVVASMTEDMSETVAEATESQVPDETLLAELKNWRSTQAAAEKLPPYMVFHDTTLVALATRRPQTSGALLAVRGMGKQKLEKYETALLEMLCSAPVND